jgi:predicted CxxxxCH...CXXCH cytochrome family protein
MNWRNDRRNADKIIFPWLFSSVFFFIAAVSAHGASLCNDCHGMPPIDAAYRNITTGGFKGNHQTHQPPSATPSSCEPCHPGSSSYVSGHEDGVITIAANINNSPLAATYSKGVFFNQTSLPVLGTCATVNCHFEAVTPVWGSAPLTSPAGCSICHSNPPSDGNHPAITGAGKKHGDYYGTSTTSCGKCHSNHTVEAKPFAHATSTGHRGIVVSFSAAPNSGGSYSKTANLAYPAYLPSQTTAANRNGTCSTTYCHSDGNGGAPKSAAVWGGTLPADCSGCHGGNAASTAVIGTGLHAQHINNAAVLGTNYECARCHNGSVSAGDDRAITGIASHVDGSRTVVFSGGGTYAAGARTCSATTCHSAGKATAPQPPAPVWTGAAMGCNGCHGISTTTGAPDYANGGAAAILANSHAKHVASAADCDACHTNTTATGTAVKTGSVLHTNGAIDVSFNVVRVGATATWTATTKTCANTYCHGATLTGGTTKSPVWGATLSGCGTCHGYPPATATHSGVTPTDCITCHTHVNATGTGFTDATKHMNGTIDAAGGHAVPYYTHNTASLTNCAGCHNTSAAGTYPAAVAGTAPNCRGCHTAADPTVTATGCTSCHANPPSGTTHPNIAGSHSRHGILAGTPNNCAICHTGAGSGSGVAHGPGNKGTNPAVDNIVFTAAQAGAAAAWNGTAKTCSSTYCHGTAATVAWGSPALACNACHAANSTLPGAHAIHYASTALPRNFNNFSGNTSTAAAYRFTCSSCHASGTGKAAHFSGTANANGVAQVFYSYTTATQKGSYTYGTTQGTDNGFSWTNGGTGCNTSYCHSNGQGGNGLVAVAWSTTASTGTCVQCHDTKLTGATATRLSGKHDAHMNPTTNASLGLGNGFNCVDCHAKTVSGTTVVSDKSRHVNKFVDYSGVKAGGSTRYNRTTKQCSNIYCHSNGNPNAIVYANPAAWNAVTTLGCNGCHGTTSTIGAPDYANGGAVPSTTANSHAKHIAGATDTTICATCHVKTVSMTVASRFKDYTAANYHLNRTPNVFFNTVKAGAGAAWTQATGTCANTYCHGATLTGGTNKSPVWGATLTGCGTCHGFPPATASGVHTGKVATDCITCHPHVNATGTGFTDATKHMNGTIDASGGHAVPFYAHATPPFTSCAGCHNTSAAGPYPAAVAGTAPNCRGCHATADPTVTSTGCTSCHASPPSGTTHPNLVGSHGKHGTLAGAPAACAICHNGAGTGSGAAHGPGNKGTNPAVDNVVFTAAQAGATATWDTTTKTCANTYCHGATLAGGGTTKNPTWGTTLIGCGTCHGDPPATGTHTGVTVTQCITCHPHVNAAGTGFTDATKHMNGVIDASGGVSAGGTTCFTCHSSFQTAMDATGATRTASYHHVLGGAAGNGDIAPNAGSYQTSTTDVYCTSCHADHNYFNNGGTVTTKAANLRTDIANASAAAPTNTDFLTTGSYGICVSCHSASLTRDTINQKAGGVATTPVIAGAVFSASMHNYTTISSFGTQNFAANCVKCHTDEQAKDKHTSANKFGPHFSASVSLLDDLGAGTVAQYREQYICFRCNSQTTDTALGGTLKPVNGKDWFGSTTMRSFAEDTFKSFTSAGRSPRHKISAYSGLHKVNETRTDIAASKHVECADCHNPHAVKFGNHSSTVPGTAKGSRANTLANVLTGAAGVSVTTWGTNWTGATTYNPATTTAPLVTATAEWQVCFKCHSGANANVATWGGAAATAAAFTDLALEFNPNNASGHPVVAALPVANRLTAAKLKGGWVPGSIMTCSDCHATDSTASKGPHGSSVKWMLAGVNKAWPYTSAAANGTSSGTYFRIATYSTGNGTKDGLFCLNCHTVTGSNNWHSQSNITGGQHGGSATGPPVCVNCHIRVPHGGKISRLLQTTNAPARYRANGSSGTPLFGAWGTSTANIKGSTFSSSNFKSSCSEHSSGGSGGEAW